ncbi:MAG: glutamine--fructose-6-phosphate transaminase (isomerizing) [Bdellovibrionales bacterium]
MCGIFAYSGSQSVPQVLIQGLKKLEYRGYDSSGMAFFDGGEVQHLRVCGGVSELEKLLSQKNYQGHLGIGHTRWATHGAPSEKNAHPQKSSCIYVVHNGVIENENELRRQISSQKFTSETDTEVIAHLIFEECEKNNSDLLKSVFKVVKLLKGSYAVVVLNKNNPDELIAFKKGPPLMLCQGQDQYFISSDPHVCGETSDQILFLEDEEILHLKKNEFQIYNFEGKKIQRKFEKINHEESFSEKKGFPHFMLKEIFEQPQSIARSLAPHIDKDSLSLNLKISKGDLQDFNKLFKDHSQMLILACGSSYYAGLFAKYFIEDITPLRVDVEMASEFIYRKSFVEKGTPVLFISQSGETADILIALEQIKQKNLEPISLCNVKGSTLDRKAKYGLYMEAQKEVGVASTKTFSSSLVVLSLLGLHISKVKKSLDPKEANLFVKNLVALPTYVEEVLNCDKFFLKSAETLKKFSGFFYLGRGLYYPMALEGALKLKEIAYLHAEAYPSGEMKHGPLAMIDESVVVLILLPLKGRLFEKTLTSLKEVKSRGAYIIGLGNGTLKDTGVEDLCDNYIELPEIHPLLHPLLTLIPLQMLAYYISRSYGYNADRPRNLAKSVTVE